MNMWFGSLFSCIRSFVLFDVMCLLMCSYKSLVFVVCCMYLQCHDYCCCFCCSLLFQLYESVFKMKLAVLLQLMTIFVFICSTYASTCIWTYYLCILMAPSRLINISIKDHMDMECCSCFCLSLSLAHFSISHCISPYMLFWCEKTNSPRYSLSENRDDHRHTSDLFKPFARPSVIYSTTKWKTNQNINGILHLHE